MKTITIRLEVMKGIFMLLPTIVWTDESSISFAWLQFALTFQRIEA